MDEIATGHWNLRFLTLSLHLSRHIQSSPAPYIDRPARTIGPDVLLPTRTGILPPSLPALPSSDESLYCKGQPHEKRDRERETQDQAIGLKFYGAYLWLQTNQSCRALLFYGPQFISWLLKDLPHPCPTPTIIRQGKATDRSAVHHLH